MNFDYIVSKQGIVNLNPIDCDSCAIIAVKGEASTNYNFNCFFNDIQKDKKRIRINKCLASHGNRIIHGNFTTDSLGKAFIVIGAEIDVFENISSGDYQGSIDIIITKKQKEEK